MFFDKTKYTKHTIFNDYYYLRRKNMIRKRRNFYQKITVCGLSAMMLLSGVLPNGTALSVQAASEPTEQYNITENGDMTYIATMKNDASYDRVMAKAESMDALAEDQPTQLEENNVAVLELDENDVNRIKQINGVVTLEEDVILTANEEVPIDEELVDTLVENEATLPFSQWNMDAINLPDSLSLSGDNVKVAVLDSGISTSEYLSVAEYVDLTDSGNENPLFNDGTGHGTSIASVIAASDLGDMYGIAPNAELYDVKVLDGDNSAPLSKIIEGIYWCIDNDIDIINMSLGTSVYSAALEQAVDAAEEAGIVMVAAAGNNGTEATNIDYPAAFDNVIAVGASDGNNALTDFTSTGDGIDILAPGEKVWSYGAFQGLQAIDGTSIATAHVTGAAALLLEKYPNADMEFIRQLFMASSNQESNGSDLGVLNIGEALTMGDGFQVQSAATKIKPQVPSVTTYDTSDIVSGSWGGTDHKNMISVLGSTTALKVAANAADLVDKYYHSDDSLRIKCKALHGVHNYVTNLHFLYEVAKNADNTAMGNKTSLTNYVKGINVPYSKDKTFGKEDLDILRQVIVDACTDPNGMGAKINADSKKTRRYMILGMAAHLLGDTFAHRTMVPVGASGGSSKDSKTFVKTHFKDWNDFSKRYTGLYIEFRDIKNYLKGTDNPYTDKSDFFPNRFTAAKTGVANLFKRYENENSFSVSKFYIETGFSKKLNNFNGYLESAGQGKVADEYSTANYRVDAPSGNISGNEKDYKDYNYSIYK